MKIIKTFLIGGIIIAILIALLCLFSFLTWSNLPELMFQYFLPKEVISKGVKDVEIYDIAKVHCINGSFYFSNTGEKIAYIDNNYNLVIFDIETKKESKIYKFRNSDFNQTFSKRVFRSCQPRLLWSSDNTKILFADFPDLFVYDFISNTISKQGEFKIRDAHEEKVFKTGLDPIYGILDYSWVDSISVKYLNSLIPHYIKDKPKQFLIKNVQNSESKIIDSADEVMGYTQSEALKSPNGQKSFLIRDIDEKIGQKRGYSGRILIRDEATQKQKEINLKPIRVKYYSYGWLSNKYILFYGNEIINNSSVDNTYRLDAFTEEITKYPNRFDPVPWPSTKNEKVILSFRSDRFYTGDATAYRYHNLVLFDKDGKEVFLYRILCKLGEIINCSWDKYSKHFYFITADYNIAPGSGDSFDKNKASKYSIQAIALK